MGESISERDERKRKMQREMSEIRKAKDEWDLIEQTFFMSDCTRGYESTKVEPFFTDEEVEKLCRCTLDKIKERGWGPYSAKQAPLDTLKVIAEKCVIEAFP